MKRTLKNTLPIIAICAMMGLSFNSCKNSDASKVAELQNQLDSINRVDSLKRIAEAEKQKQDSIMNAQAEEEECQQNENQAICAAYISTVHRLGNCTYFLHDITHDGIPELFVRTGMCEADYALQVYTYQGGKMKKMGERGAGHTAFYLEPNKVIEYWAHMDSYGISSFGSKNGNLVEYGEIDSGENVGDYPTINSPEAHEYDCGDFSPIRSALGV